MSEAEKPAETPEAPPVAAPETPPAAPEPEPTPRELHRRLAAKVRTVNHAIGYLQRDKDMKVDEGGRVIKYLSAEKIVGEVNDAAVQAAGIVARALSRITGTEILERWGAPQQNGQQLKRSPQRCVTVELELWLTDVDTGWEELWARCYGSGTDAGDKATNKAETNALKTAWAHAFNIASGLDKEPESDVADPGEPRQEARAPQTIPYSPTIPPPPVTPAPDKGAVEDLLREADTFFAAATGFLAIAVEDRRLLPLAQRLGTASDYQLRKSMATNALLSSESRSPLIEIPNTVSPVWAAEFHALDELARAGKREDYVDFFRKTVPRLPADLRTAFELYSTAVAKESGIAVAKKAKK